MVLILFFLGMMFASSWQEEITEKSLNEMLDQLIEGTVIASYSAENENNSRIFHLKQNNLTRRTYDPRLSAIHSSEYNGVDDLVNQIESSNHPNNVPANYNSDEVGNDVKFHKDHITGHHHSKTEDKTQSVDDENSEVLISRVEERHNQQVAISPLGPQSNLIHNYPEIIIDQISYDVTENIPEPMTGTRKQPNVKYLTNKEKQQVAAKTLDSLVKILLKGTQLKKNLETSNEMESDDNVLRSTHIHNDYHNHVINNVPLPFSGLLPSGKMSLLPKGYRDLQRIINGPSAYIDHESHLSRWGNPGQTSLMSTMMRTRNRNRVQFIPKPLNILPRFVYVPQSQNAMFHRKYPG